MGKKKDKAKKKLKKKEDFYFNNFAEAAEISLKTADLLQKILEDFSEQDLPANMDKIHEWENRGDEKKHEMMRELVRAFITPIEREDILRLSQNIDDVTDALDDICIHIYITGTREIRPEGLEFSALLCRACKAMCNMLEEFRHFKKSKKLGEYLMRINDIEEEGDRLYSDAMRRLHTENTQPHLLVAWREIFGYFEKCCDACEHVADIVENIVIGNT